MNEFNIQKCKKALKSVRREEKDLESAYKKGSKMKSKTDSPFLVVKPSTETHQKTKSYNGNNGDAQFSDFMSNTSSPINESKILPPVLWKKQPIKNKKNMVISLVSIGKNEFKEESKKQEKSKLTEEMYNLLYGKYVPSEKKKEEKQTSKVLKMGWNSKLFDHKIMSVRNSWDDGLVGVASFDGFIKIIDLAKRQTIGCYSDSDNFQVPITNIRWKPQSKEELILFSYLSGDVILYDHSEERQLSKIKANHKIYGLDYNVDGSSLALCGNDVFISIFDSETSSQTCKLSSPPIKERNCHHIYGLKFDPINPSLLFSGGWDEIIYLWDLRKPSSAANFLTGPLISTESIDVLDDKLISGSWRKNNQLEVWDLRRFRKIQDLDWNSGNDSVVQVCKFNRNNSKVVLSSGTSQAGVQVFKEEGLWQKIDEFCSGEETEYFSADFSHKNENEFSIGNSKGEICLMNFLK